MSNKDEIEQSLEELSQKLGDMYSEQRQLLMNKPIYRCV